MMTYEDVLKNSIVVGSDYLPTVVAAIAILVLGWIIAKIASKITANVMRRTTLDETLTKLIFGKEKAERLDTGHTLAKGVYYFIMIFVVISFFETLGLTVITRPLKLFLDQIFLYAPQFIGGATMVAVAWIIAAVVKRMITGALEAAEVDKKIDQQAELKPGETPSLSKNLGEASYWLILFLFMPVILGAFGLDGLLLPIQGMIADILAFIPNLFAAGAIAVVGWFVARIVRVVTTNLLATAGADVLSEKVGISKAMGELKLSGVTGTLVYILILLPVLVTALDTLALTAISQPAINMMNTAIMAIPAVFGAGVILVFAYVIGSFMSNLVANLLGGVGFNNVIERIGIGTEPEEGQRTPSELAGYGVFAYIMLFALMEAAGILNFALVTKLVASFIVFFSHVLMGLAVIGLGIHAGNTAFDRIQESTVEQKGIIAWGAKLSIFFFAGAVGLGEMGIADDIINTAFGILLGSVAVAVAIAFGLGGRKVAGDLLEEWVASMKAKRK